MGTNERERAAAPDAIGPPYGAFISYSHHDEKAARWLHTRLERFRFPKEMRGREGRFGPIEAGLGKIFRDREEFAAGAELKAEIEVALTRSRVLIVLCSPHSAASRYVNAEIDFFRGLGRDGLIIPVILDGDPTKSFPPALSNDNERLGADFRASGDGRDIGSLKVVAGIVGLGLDELVGRAQRAERRRRQLFGIAAAGFAALAVLATFFAIRAERQRAEAEGALSRVLVERGDQALSRGDANLAMRYAFAAIGLSPSAEHYAQALLRRAIAGARPREYFLTGVNDAAAIAISENGAVAALARSSGSVEVWDVERHTRLSTITQAAVEDDMLFSPDGSVLAIRNRPTSTVSLWRRNGELIARLDSTEIGGAMVFAFSADGRLLGISDFGALVFEVATGRLVMRATGNFLQSSSIVFSRDGRLVAAGTNTITRVWEVGTGALVTAVATGRDVVVALAFAPDAGRIATGSWDGVARIWDVTSGREIAALRHPEGVNDVEFSADGGSIITTARDLRIWDGATYALTRELDLGVAREIVSQRSSRRLAIVGTDASLNLVSNEGAELLASAQASAAFGVAFAENGDALIAVSADGSIQRISLAQRQSDVTVAALGPITDNPSGYDGAYDVAFAADGRSADLAIRTEVWASYALRWSFEGEPRRLALWEERGPPPVFIQLGARTYAHRSEDGAVETIAVSDDAMPVDAFRQAAAAFDVVQSLNERWILFTSGRNVWIWDVQDWSWEASFGALDEEEYDAAISNDGQSVVLRPLQGNPVLFRRTLTSIVRHELNVGRATEMAFAPDSQTVAVADVESRTVRLFDVRSGREMGQLAATSTGAVAIRFSPDGSQLFVGTSSGQLSVWDLSSETQAAAFDVGLGEIHDIDVSPDGRRVLIGASNGAALIPIGQLRASLSDLGEEACEHFLTPGRRAFMPQDLARDSILRDILRRSGRPACEVAQ